MDLKILELLQADATMPIAEIGKIVGLSTTPCWRRIQKLDEAGVIRARVAVLDPVKVNTGVTVFVSIKTDQHNLDWLERFHAAVVDLPEVVEFYRMSGEVDERECVPADGNFRDDDPHLRQRGIGQRRLHVALYARCRSGKQCRCRAEATGEEPGGGRLFEQWRRAQQ